MVTKNQFRSAMSKFATGVTVVTSLDDNGHVHGMTANAFTSVCLDPPVILVCVAHSTHTHNYLGSRGFFGVNIAGAGQQPIAQYFAKRPEDRTEELEYRCSSSSDGVPLLDGSLVSFACKVLESHVYGDHTLYIATVEEIREGVSADPLLFYESHWDTSIKNNAG